MADFDPKMIEAVAQALQRDMIFEPEAWTECVSFESTARAALRALPLSPDALNALWRGEAVVVPNEPTEAMEEAADYVRSFNLFGNPTRGTDEVLSAGNAASPYARKDKP